MDLKFSHVDVLVKNLDEACAYYAQILNAKISKTLVWERGGLHVRYAIALIGQERFMLVQPLAGNLKELLDSSGEGMIYRHCYSTPDIEKAYDELMFAGVQPEDENGQPLARAQPAIPVWGTHHLVAQTLRALLYRNPGREGAGGIYRGSVYLRKCCSGRGRLAYNARPLIC